MPEPASPATTTDRPDVAALRAAVAALPVDVDGVSCRPDTVAVPSYPDGPRPTSCVTLHGGGVGGQGEHVGWTPAEHARFAAAAPAVVPRGRTRLGDWPGALAALPPYDRAALEAAALDLALRQHDTTLFALARVPPRPLRYVVSFAVVRDPAREAAAHAPCACKIDVDPSWDDGVWHALAAGGRVAVLDWKGGGDRAAHLRAHAALPDVLHEDPATAAAPWTPGFVARRSVDAVLTGAADLDAVAPPPAAANLKVARMGGVLALLDAAARCASRDIAVYLGGMFEIGIGRRQLHVLAALLAPDGPNDVAPIPRDGEAPARPPRLLASDRPGFGA